jgi:hypothetical protein
MADDAMHRSTPWIDPDSVVETYPLLPAGQRDRCLAETAAASGWHLAVGDHGRTRLLPLVQPVLRVGRSRQCDVRIDHPSVAAHHAVLAARSAGYLLFVDTAIARTFVNGRRVSDTILLHDYDIVILGDAMVVARWIAHARGAAPGAAPAARLA